MSLCLASEDECERVRGGAPCGECTCDLGGLDALRAYVQQYFPDRAVRVFHSHSTVVHNGVPEGSAEHHILRVGDECPHCAVVTRAFLEQPVENIGARVHQWGLGSALRAERTVVVDLNGVSAV